MIFNPDTDQIEEVDPLVSRRVLPHTQNLMAVEVRFKKGGIGTMHAHEVHDQISYVLSGTFEVSVNGQTSVVGPGGGFTVEKTVQHGVKALEDGVLIDVFTPLREDFL